MEQDRQSTRTDQRATSRLLHPKGRHPCCNHVAQTVLFILCAASMMPTSSAQTIAVSPLGPEFQVNTTIVGNQNTSRAAMAPDGSYVIVWEGPDGSVGGDGIDVFAQRYDPFGSKVGPEILVNSTIPLAQHSPDVAVDDDGNFVVTYTSNTAISPALPDVLAQRFDASGNKIGLEFLVNIITDENQSTSRVDMNGGGEFVVTWQQAIAAGGSTSQVNARKYAANGTPLTGEFEVNTGQLVGASLRPAVAPDGSFVVVWGSTGVQESGVFARLYDSNANPLALPFLVNVTTELDQQSPEVGMNDNGDFVVSWISKSGVGGSGPDAVVARVFDKDGSALTGEVLVATPGFATASPVVAMTGGGEFLIAWVNEPEIAGGGNNVKARAFDFAGMPRSDIFLVNEVTTGNQVRPGIGLNDSGSWVITWGSDAVDPGDIHARGLGFADAPVFLVIDEDSIDNGSPPILFSDTDVNDDIADIGVRIPLPFFAANVGQMITLHTGEVGDEGWFAPKTVPASWVAAGPTADGISNLIAAGPGLGTPDASGDREALLDKIPDVTPLRATGLKLLEGKVVCAVVFDSDISINYGPLNGSLKGSNLGIVAFKVLSVTQLTGYSSSSLPQVVIEILDAVEVCGGNAFELLVDAPEPISSSEPPDIIPQ